MHELNHGAGKGDKERSPGWRNNYPEIHFPVQVDDGFKRVSANRIRKVYKVHVDMAVPGTDETVIGCCVPSNEDYCGKCEEVMHAEPADIKLRRG